MDSGKQGSRIIGIKEKQTEAFLREKSDLAELLSLKSGSPVPLLEALSDPLRLLVLEDQKVTCKKLWICDEFVFQQFPPKLLYNITSCNKMAELVCSNPRKTEIAWKKIEILEILPHVSGFNILAPFMIHHQTEPLSFGNSKEHRIGFTSHWIDLQPKKKLKGWVSLDDSEIPRSLRDQSVMGFQASRVHQESGFSFKLFGCVSPTAKNHKKHKWFLFKEKVRR